MPVDELRRRLLAEDLHIEGPEPPQPQQRPHSRALHVLVDGFLHGSLLTLAICTPKRDSLFSSQNAARHEAFRTYVVSMPGAKPAAAEPQTEAEPVAR